MSLRGGDDHSWSPTEERADTQPLLDERARLDSTEPLATHSPALTKVIGASAKRAHSGCRAGSRQDSSGYGPLTNGNLVPENVS